MDESDSPVLDYSTHVEVLLHEEDACLHGGAASDDDLARAVPREWAAIEAAGAVLVGTDGGMGQVYRRLKLERAALFDSFDGEFGFARPEARPGYGDWYLGQCAFCGGNLEHVAAEHQDTDTGWRKIDVGACPVCGWWQSEDLLLIEDGSHYDAYSLCRRAVLREFSVAASSVPVDAVRQHLVERGEAVTDLNPRLFERLLQAILSEHLACEVVHVGGPGDGGIDLYAVAADFPWAIQVKRRGRQVTHEGVAAVREFIGALVIAGRRWGMFVSTAPRFSAAAQLAAENAMDRGAIDQVQLIDGPALSSIMNLHAVPEPWRRAGPKLSEPRSRPELRIVAYPVGRARPEYVDGEGDSHRK